MLLSINFLLLLEEKQKFMSIFLDCFKHVNLSFIKKTLHFLYKIIIK